MTKPAVNPLLTRIATVRLEPAEHRRLQEAADSIGISLSGLIRAAALGARIPEPRPPRMDLDVATQLRRLGSLQNQALAVMHRELTRVTAPAWKQAFINQIRTAKALMALLELLKERLQ